ncbi:MAG: MarR family winged helix-turn-helix transcriptional regulator [Acidimicrobiales bacterium]
MPLPFDPIAEAKRQWDQRWPEGAAMAAATSIMRAQQLVLAAVDRALQPFGLNFARYEVLVLLAFSRKGSLPMGKMGDRLMVHPTSITNIVDRLEADSLVRRVPHPDDRRIVLAALTPEGRELVARATKAVEAVRFGVGALPDKDLARLTGLFTKLRRVAGDFTGGDDRS